MKCIRKDCKFPLEFIKHMDIVDPVDNSTTKVTLFACDCGMQILLLPESHYEL